MSCSRVRPGLAQTAVQSGKIDWARLPAIWRNASKISRVTKPAVSSAGSRGRICSRVASLESSAFNKIRSESRDPGLAGAACRLTGARDLAGSVPVRRGLLELIQHQSRLHAQIARQIVGNGGALQLVGNLLHRRQQKLERVHASVGAAHVELARAPGPPASGSSCWPHRVARDTPRRRTASRIRPDRAFRPSHRPSRRRTRALTCRPSSSRSWIARSAAFAPASSGSKLTTTVSAWRWMRPHLRVGERGAAAGDHFLHPGGINSDHIHVAFDQHRAIGLRIASRARCRLYKTDVFR